MANANLYHVIKFPINCRFIRFIIISTHNLVVSRNFVSKRTVLSCFYLLISILRNSKLESDVCRLPYTWSLNTLNVSRIRSVEVRKIYHIKACDSPSVTIMPASKGASFSVVRLPIRWGPITIIYVMKRIAYTLTEVDSWSPSCRSQSSCNGQITLFSFC